MNQTEIHLDETTCTLGEVHFERDRYDKQKKRLRDEWFQEASATFAPEALARKTVKVPIDCQADAEAYALLYNSGWRVVESNPDGTEVLIEEDPVFKGYVRVIKFDQPREILDDKDKPVLRHGYVVTRSIVSGTMLVDDERVIKLDPELWEEITEWQYPELADKSGPDEWLKNINWPRVLKPADQLTPGQIARIKPYLYEGPKTDKLLVRYAKENESE